MHIQYLHDVRESHHNKQLLFLLRNYQFYVFSDTRANIQIPHKKTGEGKIKSQQRIQFRNMKCLALLWGNTAYGCVLFSLRQPNFGNHEKLTQKEYAS